MAFVLARVERPGRRRCPSRPVDPQQGAIEDHERLALRDRDRLGQRGGHGGEQVERLAQVAVDRARTDLESAGQIDVGLTFSQVGHDQQGLLAGIQATPPR
jgi:hypothetical protein